MAASHFEIRVFIVAQTSSLPQKQAGSLCYKIFAVVLILWVTRIVCQNSIGGIAEKSKRFHGKIMGNR